MKDVKQSKGRLGTLALGVSLMGALYGWFVYAGEIETDVSNVAQIVVTTNKGTPVDPTAVTALGQIGNNSEAQLNSAITTDLYGAISMAPADAMITKHFGTYCADSSESGSCTQDPLLQFGDVKVSSILSGTSYDSSRAQAAQDFLTNYISPPNNPFVTNFQANMSNGKMSAATVTADPTLKSNYAQALSEEALLSVIRESFAEMIAKRTVNAATNASWMQSMEAEVLQRAMNGDWVKSLTAASVTGQQVAVEQAKIQAQQLLLAYESYRQGERIEALLTALALQNFRSSKQAQSAVANQPNATSLQNTTSTDTSTSGQ